MSVSRRASPSWPFWLLLAAWACANTPAGSLPHFLGWLGEARNFSHQARLSVEVACLLTGQSDAGKVESTPDLPGPSAPVALADEVLTKKLDLALEHSGQAWESTRSSARHPLQGVSDPGRRRTAPPHEPPRDRERLT